MSSSAHDPITHDRRPRRTLSLGALVLGLFVVQAAIIGVALLATDLPV